METSLFDYDLPPELIAQSPVEPRDSSRLLVLDRATGTVRHGLFRDLASFLRPGDLLVLNETRVLAARLQARKSTGGRVEILMLRRLAPLTWEVMVGGKGVRLGTRLDIPGRAGLSAVVMEAFPDARRIIQFSEPISSLLGTVGHVPLPPYIHQALADGERYQTVYARIPGSAAAPTAGLHFTPELLAGLKEAGVGHAFVTLHIGLDTFAPVTEDQIEHHKIHSEWCHLPREAARDINQARSGGGRIVAVGTTVVRVLETAARASSDEGPFETQELSPSAAGGFRRRVLPVVGKTNLFIVPGHTFQLVDAMITNFHLPRSTLLMLVSAFAGREQILAAYEAAIAARYRFYSFGDAMLIL